MNLNAVYEKVKQSNAYAKNNIQEMYKLMFKLYQSIRIDHILPIVYNGFDFSEDCLLFEYGNYDLQGRDYFTVNLSRQVLLEKKDGDEKYCFFNNVGIYSKYERIYGGDIEDKAIWCRSIDELEGFIERVNRYDCVFEGVLCDMPEEFDVKLYDDNSQRLPATMFC